jgi:ABC-type tungstate transport system permease subunit
VSLLKNSCIRRLARSRTAWVFFASASQRHAAPQFAGRQSCDKSGTDALEKRLWRAVAIDPAQAGGGSWYRDIGGGMGPHSTLLRQ